MGKPRILVLCPDIPYPIVAGGHMRMASMIPALAKTGMLHVVFNNGGRKVSDETAAWFSSHEITWSGFSRKKRGMLQNALQKISMLCMRDNLYHYHDEQDVVSRKISDFKPDCIWLETPYQCRYVLHVRRKIPVIVDYWGLLSEGSMRDYQHAPLRKKTAKWLYWKIATAAEKKYARAFPYAVTVSAPVSAYIQKNAPLTHVTSIPNGIVKKTAAEVEKYGSMKCEYDFIMSGDFSFAPNINAALYFVHDVFPLIKKARPDATLCCAGRDPVSEIRCLAEEPGITVTGFVDDLLGIIAKARVYVLPLRMGSGIRSKLFDVFPLGKPIVTTSTGAEGLELSDGENCFITDDTHLFARRCRELLENKRLRKKLGEAVKKCAYETYAQKTVEKKIEKVIRMVTHGEKNG